MSWNRIVSLQRGWGYFVVEQNSVSGNFLISSAAIELTPAEAESVIGAISKVLKAGSKEHERESSFAKASSVEPACGHPECLRGARCAKH